MARKIDRNKVRWQAARDQFDAAARNDDTVGQDIAEAAMWDVPGSLDYQQEYLDKKYKRNGKKKKGE